MITLLAAVAGGLGAAARLVVDGAIRTRIATAVPVGTLAVNLTGCLALGVLMGLAGGHHLPGVAATIAGTGFLGGYTTFSTASFEMMRLLQQRSRRAALLYALATLVGGLGAAAVGLAVTGGF